MKYHQVPTFFSSSILQYWSAFMARVGAAAVVPFHPAAEKDLSHDNIVLYKHIHSENKWTDFIQWNMHELFLLNKAGYI